ncbi:MAG: hypothetical protein GX181_04090 [Synergistaceae bacterium]|nr:hypothetical protein [Synergistaceae bacterium]
MRSCSSNRSRTDAQLARIAIALVLAVALLGGTASASDTGVEKEKPLIDWGQTYIEGTGMAVAPEGTTGAQAKALARRGALVDLQRNMLEFVCGVQIDSRTTMDDFMAEDMVRSEVHGMIRNVEMLKGEWDGESYTVTGRIKTEQLRQIVDLVVTLVR